VREASLAGVFGDAFAEKKLAKFTGGV